MTKEVTRDLLRVLRDELNAAIAPIAAKHGVALQVGNASFTPTTATFKLEVGILDGAPEGASTQVIKAQADWKRLARSFGLDPAWLGKSFSYAGVTATILGLMPKRTKYPILVDKAGKHFLLPIESVRALMRQGELA